MKRAQGDGGFTLVELLVVLVLMGVVGGVVLTAIVTAFDSARVTTARATALTEVETGLQRLARDLRTAEDVIITGDPRSSINVNIVREGEGRTVSYRVEGDNSLVREDSGQTLVTFIENDLDVQPVFTYYQFDGQFVPCTVDGCPADRIEITLVRGIEGRSPVVATTSVAVRNNVRYGG